MTKSPLYGVWKKMRYRCSNPRTSQFKDYGGRGITVCEEWGSFEAFRGWAESNGYSRGLQIDRINNNGHYTPENCRWVTPSENARNRNNNLHITAFGETKVLQAWFEDKRCVVEWRTLYDRLKRGLDPEEALTRPAVYKSRARKPLSELPPYRLRQIRSYAQSKERIHVVRTN